MAGDNRRGNENLDAPDAASTIEVAARRSEEANVKAEAALAEILKSSNLGASPFSDERFRSDRTGVLTASAAVILISAGVIASVSNKEEGAPTMPLFGLLFRVDSGILTALLLSVALFFLVSMLSGMLRSWWRWEMDRRFWKHRADVLLLDYRRSSKLALQALVEHQQHGEKILAEARQDDHYLGRLASLTQDLDEAIEAAWDEWEAAPDLAEPPEPLTPPEPGPPPSEGQPPFRFNKMTFPKRPPLEPFVREHYRACLEAASDWLDPGHSEQAMKCLEEALEAFREAKVIEMFILQGEARERFQVLRRSLNTLDELAQESGTLLDRQLELSKEIERTADEVDFILESDRRIRRSQVISAVWDLAFPVVLFVLAVLAALFWRGSPPAVPGSS